MLRSVIFKNMAELFKPVLANSYNDVKQVVKALLVSSSNGGRRFINKPGRVIAPVWK